MWYHHYPFRNLFVPNGNSALTRQTIIPPRPPLPAPGSHYSHFCLNELVCFRYPPISGIIHSDVSCQFISLSIIFSRFFHVVACARISFLVKADKYSTVCIYILFTHSSVIHSSFCHLFATMSNNAMNTGAQLYV